MEIGIIIVAAGSSSRLGQPKQLVSYLGKSLLQHTIDEARKVDPKELIVVLGAFRDELKDLIQDARVIYNEHWSRGMGASIATGVASLSDSVEGVLILQCDQPYVDAQHLHEILKAANRDSQIVISEYKKASGPPCYFSSNYFHELCLLDGDEGAKSIVRKHKGSMTRIPFLEGEFDIDTPEDLKALKSKT